MDFSKKMYDKLNEELKLLEEQMKEIKKSKEETETKYNNINNEIKKQKEKLKELNYLKENLPYQEYFKISLIVGIPTIIILFSLITAYIYLTTIRIVSLGLLIDNSIILGFISPLLGIPTIGFIGTKIASKIQKKLEENSYNKITNSQEYLNILKQIKVLEESIDNHKDEALTLEINLIVIRSNYNCHDTEITIKKALINYIEREMSKLEEPKQEKTYTRRKTLDNQ